MLRWLVVKWFRFIAENNIENPGGDSESLTDSDIRLGLIYLQIQNMYLNAK